MRLCVYLNHSFEGEGGKISTSVRIRECWAESRRIAVTETRCGCEEKGRRRDYYGTLCVTGYVLLTETNIATLQTKSVTLNQQALANRRGGTV